MKPSIAIVILNWNGRHFLDQFLPSVVASAADMARVVVVDNASGDDSVFYLQNHWPEVELIRNSSNEGFARGYNEGLKQVKADYYALLNSDVEVSPSWLSPMLDLLEKNPEIAVCQPKLLQFQQRDLFEYAGAAGGWLDYLGYPFARGRIFDYCETDRGQYDSVEPVFWASGAAMFIRSSVFHTCGGFDEYFFAHQEEIDLCWRIQLSGHRVYACPASVVYHVGGGTLPKGNARKVFLNFRNNLVMMAKNLPLSQSAWKIPYRFVLDTVSAVKSLFNGELTYFLAVFKAHFAFLAWVVKKKNRQFYPVRRTGRLDAYFQRSVVWQHFILGRKKFDEIVKKKS